MSGSWLLLKSTDKLQVLWNSGRLSTLLVGSNLAVCATHAEASAIHALVFLATPKHVRLLLCCQQLWTVSTSALFTSAGHLPAVHTTDTVSLLD